MQTPTRVATHLSEGVHKRPPTYLRSDSGYRLERARRKSISLIISSGHVIKSPNIELRRLEGKLREGAEREYLIEAINCFEVGAYRASILLVWILVMDHMFDFVFNKHRSAFNVVLAKNNDKRVKIKAITKSNDFSDMSESKFIELCRSARIISNDVRKILDQKLGTRNSCAHPSGILIKRSKASEFIEDLIENVILKH